MKKLLLITVFMTLIGMEANASKEEADKVFDALIKEE